MIIGAGQAGAQLAVSLREEGYAGGIALLGDEPRIPYQRPPLSKEFLGGKLPESQLPFRSANFYEDQDIWFKPNTRVAAVNRPAKQVALDSGQLLPYDQLVFATGTRNRELPIGPGNPSNVHYLRTWDEANQLKTALDSAQHVLVIGAGFIGMEFASIAAEHDLHVTVLSASDRVMSRAVSPVVSKHFEARHRDRGVDLRHGAAVDEYLLSETGEVRGARIGGEELPVDLVLIAIGVEPNDELAAGCGLATRSGIIVDASLATADPDVFALGDVARYPSSDGQLVRIESVPNAADQARYLARRLQQETGAYSELPWFWSHQAGDKLQIAGLSMPGDQSLVLGDQASGKYSVARLRDGKLVAVESINSAGEHLASRKILASGAELTAEDLAAEGFTLRAASKTLIPA